MEGNEMKYAEFKKALDEYFSPDDEIFPHASGGVVTLSDFINRETKYYAQKAIDEILNKKH
jgi:hypothetical protein